MLNALTAIPATMALASIHVWWKHRVRLVQNALENLIDLIAGVQREVSEIHTLDAKHLNAK